MTDSVEKNRDWQKESEELSRNFFVRWSVLSGSTLTLFIPFIQSLDGAIIYKTLLLVVEILLVISLLTSSLYPWFASKLYYFNALQAQHKKYRYYAIAQRISHRAAIYSYVIAIVLGLFFINANIF